MRKCVTVLMMIILLSMPHNMAWAVKSGSGSGSGQGKGGYDVNVTLEQAVARPAFFLTLALTQIFVIATSFQPRFLAGNPRLRSQFDLISTGTLTTAFFALAVVKFIRYFVYIMIANPYFTQYLSAPPQNGQVPELDDDIYSLPVEEVSTVIRKTATTTPPPTPPYFTEKERAINAAVDRALRDPELAEKYLQFATPEVREAVNKALDNQFEFENRNRYRIEERWEGDFDAFGTPTFLRQ